MNPSLVNSSLPLGRITDPTIKPGVKDIVNQAGFDESVLGKDSVEEAFVKTRESKRKYCGETKQNRWMLTDKRIISTHSR